MPWPRCRSTTSSMPTPSSGPGLITRCGNGSPDTPADLLHDFSPAPLAERLREQVRASRCPVLLRVAVAMAPGPRQPFTTVLHFDNRGEDPGRAVEAVTGQLLRYEVTADAEGYLTVLNFGAEGKVETFLPQGQQTGRRLVPGQPAKLITALAPPAGKEHVAVIWTRQPSRLGAMGWHQRLEAAERGQVLGLAEGESAEDWTAVVVPVVQRACERGDERAASPEQRQRR